MNEFSKEVIEIEGKEYTLFLNRAGVVAIEKFTREEKQKVENLQSIVNDVENGEIVTITEETDPLAGLDGMVEDSLQIQETTYKKMFWIMLSPVHKLSYSQACELYDKAYKDYGYQLNDLLIQMSTDVNENRIIKEEQNQELKKLAALRPTK
jgi:hypothetical protein